MDRTCPPCPKCWSAAAVRIEMLQGSRAHCRCERCGTVWVHDEERVAAILKAAAEHDGS